MLKRAPTVYVPVEPEGDGLTIPSLLSIVVHCSIVAFIVFSHRIPKIEVPPAIETSIMTPEQLAGLQSDIIANRNALGASGSQSNTGESADALEIASSEANDVGSEQQTSTTITRSVPVFIQSDEEPDDYTSSDVLVDPEIKQRLAEKEEAYQKAQEEYQRQQLEEAEKRIEAYGDSVEEDMKAEQERVEELLEKEKNPEKVKKPERVERTYPAQTKKDDKGGSSPPQTVSLGGNGNASNSASGNGSNSQNGASGAGGNNNDSDLAGRVSATIYRNWNTPEDRKGTKVKATFKVGANGKAYNISVQTSDVAVKASLEQAISTANLSFAAGKPFSGNFIVR